MDLTDIEMFLVIVDTKSISKTAETLFLSQPTISHRLKLLEKEINFPLFVRNKGFKHIELTQAGIDFIPIAERMMSLWKETRYLCDSNKRALLTIGATDSINTALLAPFYQEIINRKSVLDLNIRTHQSHELYGILDAHDIDLAFVYYHLYYKNILCECIFQEKLYLVQSHDPEIAKPQIHTDELDPEKELYMKWNDPYQIWHNRWLTNYSRPSASVDTITMLWHFWDYKTHPWIIAPESVIQEFYRSHSLYVSEILNQPPNRLCYKIKPRLPLSTNEAALSYFETELTRYLSELKFDIHVGEVWPQKQN